MNQGDRVLSRSNLSINLIGSRYHIIQSFYSWEIEKLLIRCFTFQGGYKELSETNGLGIRGVRILVELILPVKSSAKINLFLVIWSDQKCQFSFFIYGNYIHDLLVWGDDVVQNIFLFSSLQKHNFSDETFQTYRSAYFHFIHYLHWWIQQMLSDFF